MTTLKDAIKQAIRDHGDEAIWSDGGQDWTLDNYLNETMAAMTDDPDWAAPRDLTVTTAIPDWATDTFARRATPRDFALDAWDLYGPDGAMAGCMYDLGSGYLFSGGNSSYDGDWDGSDLEGQVSETAPEYHLLPVYYDGRTIRRYRKDGTIDTGEAMLRLSHND
jgi:hypothetical protein